MQQEVAPLGAMCIKRLNVQVIRVGAHVSASLRLLVDYYTKQKGHKIIIKPYFSSNEANAVL